MATFSCQVLYPPLFYESWGCFKISSAEITHFCSRSSRHCRHQCHASLSPLDRCEREGRCKNRPSPAKGQQDSRLANPRSRPPVRHMDGMLVQKSPTWLTNDALRYAGQMFRLLPFTNGETEGETLDEMTTVTFMSGQILGRDMGVIDPQTTINFTRSKLRACLSVLRAVSLGT